jgi:Holliday junction resolvasome RuvABC endonuclease subunit
MKRTIGLDLSLSGTGICIMEDFDIIFQQLVSTSPQKEKTGKMIIKKGKEVEETVVVEFDDMRRIYYIRSQILKAIADHIPIHYGAIEGPALGVQDKTTSIHTLGKLAGVVEYLLKFELEIPYYLVSPSTLKKHTTGRGIGKKEMMLKEVYKKYGLDFNDNNLCDAFCLCTTLLPTGFDPSLIKIRRPELKLRRK